MKSYQVTRHRDCGFCSNSEYRLNTKHDEAVQENQVTTAQPAEEAVKTNTRVDFSTEEGVDTVIHRDSNPLQITGSAVIGETASPSSHLDSFCVFLWLVAKRADPPRISNNENCDVHQYITFDGVVLETLLEKINISLSRYQVYKICRPQSMEECEQSIKKMFEEDHILSTQEARDLTNELLRSLKAIFGFFLPYDSGATVALKYWGAVTILLHVSKGYSLGIPIIKLRTGYTKTGQSFKILMGHPKIGQAT